MREGPDLTFVSDPAGDPVPMTLASRSSQASLASGSAYQDIVNDTRYAHFVNIPGRIIRCLDYLEITADRESIKECLHSYYLFIGVLDDAIDHGHIVNVARVLDQLASGTLPPVGHDPQSTVTLATEVLRPHIPEACRQRIFEKLEELYDEVLNERAATAIEAYLDCRIAVGSLTAELSYLLMRPHLNRESEVLCLLMKQVGAVGCLVDSLIDLKMDSAIGLLAFNPTLVHYLQLTWRTARLGLQVTFQHPLLCPLFLQAIIDNIRDRLTRNQPLLHTVLVSEGKDQAAGVA